MIVIFYFLPLIIIDGLSLFAQPGPTLRTW